MHNFEYNSLKCFLSTHGPRLHACMLAETKKWEPILVLLCYSFTHPLLLQFQGVHHLSEVSI